ncbi:MAG: hypothetical protein P1V81_05410 [Planctomycetota bacterium]|nr:hypothetical protein [Planctomycetota bacterium]
MESKPPERRSLYLPALVLLGLCYAVGLGGLDLFLWADAYLAEQQLAGPLDALGTTAALVLVLLLPLALGFAACRVRTASVRLTCALLLLQPFGCATLARAPDIAPFPLWPSLVVNLVVVACLLLPRWLLARRRAD